MQLVAELQNALNIGYEQKMNELWTASFSMPQDDPKNAECLPLRFVEIFDNGERIDIFRIIPTDTKRGSDGKTVVYQCEHVLATLVDDVLFQYHRIDDTLTTTQSLQYILDSQITERWQLGTNDFTHHYEYKWENANLLGAVFSIPQPFIEDYHFTFDTTTTPWTLNLKELPLFGDPDCYIRYGKNLMGITKTEDPTYIVNRLYGLGYGEGVNQLTISEVNSNVPYVEDTASQALYGVISDIFVDKRFESPDTLKAQMQRVLENGKTPKFTYAVEGADISSITGDSIDKFRAGALASVYDEELGIDIVARVIKAGKSNVIGEPWNVKIEIANKLQTMASAMAELKKRQLIAEVYAQGATNLDSHDFADNADATHPAIIRFYIPAETVRINKMMLSYETSNFRSYERAIEAAPAVTSGASSITTTASGGATVNTDTGTNVWNISGAYSIPDVMEFVSGHAHGIVPHNHIFSLPNHTHGMEHTHQIPAHTHGIEYGIFLNPSLPTTVTITVDGNTVPVTAISGENIDIIPYLAIGGDGKVTRDAWHEIKITPDDLGRITANVVTQLFVQSRGGGNY
jgi:phage minor structural protein